MKRLVLAVALSYLAAPAFADGPSVPIIEPEVIIVETAASSGGDNWVGILLTLIVFGAALAR